MVNLARCGSSCAGRGASRRVDLIPFFPRVSLKLTITSHRTRHTGCRRLVTFSSISTDRLSSAQVAPWLRRGRWNCIPIKALEVKSNNNNRAAPRGGPQNKGGGDSQLFTPEMSFSHLCGSASCALRALSVALVLNVRRCDRRAHRTAFAHGIDRVSSSAFLHGAPRALLHLRREHMRLPLSPSKLWVCPRAYFHSRAPPPTRCRSASLLSTPARFTARDCLILRPRAGLPLSRD